MSERIYVTKKDKITVNENNLVNLSLQNGDVFEKLEPRRLFPVSRIDEYITLLDTDGKEIAVIRKLSDIDTESREVIEYSLNDYYLVPHITRIISITEKNGKYIGRWKPTEDTRNLTFETVTMTSGFTVTEEYAYETQTITAT